MQIEARVMGDLAINHILPAAIEYQNKLIANVKGLKEAGLTDKAYCAQQKILNEISDHIQTVYTKVDEMVEARKIANNIDRYPYKSYCLLQPGKRKVF